MASNLRDEIDEFGFATISQIVDKNEIEKLLLDLQKLNHHCANTKENSAIYGVRNLLNLIPEISELAKSERILSLVKEVLGENAKLVRAIFFDKTPDANWKVPLHQDLTIAVAEKRETAGFTAWTKKADIQHVQPPIEILEKTIALRIHLDDADETNGALKVVPKSHESGRLSAEEIQILRQANELQLCRIKRGEGFLMRPLLIHASSAGTMPKHRRVIHIEYSAENLPNGLKWYGS